MEWVGIDLAVPFPVSRHGNKNALEVTDCFIKYVKIHPIPNRECWDCSLPGNFSPGMEYLGMTNLRADYSRKCASYLEFIRPTRCLLDRMWQAELEEQKDTTKMQAMEQTGKKIGMNTYLLFQWYIDLFSTNQWACLLFSWCMAESLICPWISCYPCPQERSLHLSKPAKSTQICLWNGPDELKGKCSMAEESS